MVFNVSSPAEHAGWAAGWMNNGVPPEVAVRLIVFDLDGTLLGADNRLSDYSAAVLRRASADEGITLMAASGRSHWAADLVLDSCPEVDHVICSNGAVLWQRTTGTVVRRRTITQRRFTHLHATVNEMLEGACWAWETERGIVPDDVFRWLGTRPGYELDELLASPDLHLQGDPGLPILDRLAGYGTIVRGLLAHPEMPAAEVYRRLHGRVPARLSSSSAIFLEVTAPKVGKAAMLRDYCKRAGIARDEVVAFGDHMNDLRMLQWAGRGIAVAGAYHQVLARIPEHTDRPNHADGVAIHIEKILADR